MKHLYTFADKKYKIIIWFGSAKLAQIAYRHMINIGCINTSLINSSEYMDYSMREQQLYLFTTGVNNTMICVDYMLHGMYIPRTYIHIMGDSCNFNERLYVMDYINNNDVYVILEETQRNCITQETLKTQTHVGSNVQDIIKHVFPSLHHNL